jgi:hypothetical protein
MTDDSSSWPREGSIAEIDFHTPTHTVGSSSSRIRQNPSGRFEAMPPPREAPRPLDTPPFLSPGELPRPQRRDSGAFRATPARLDSSSPKVERSPSTAPVRQAEVSTMVVAPPTRSWGSLLLLGVAALGAATLVIWLLLRQV